MCDRGGASFFDLTVHANAIKDLACRMSIPNLTADGLLPPGIHDCTMAEIQQHFGRFQHNDTRVRLTEKLKGFHEEHLRAKVAVWLGIDGSYVTAKDSPNDVDLVVVLPACHDGRAELRPFVYSILSKRRVKQRYAFDILVAVENSPQLQEYLDFFQRTRDHKLKGLLKVAI